MPLRKNPKRSTGAIQKGSHPRKKALQKIMTIESLVRKRIQVLKTNLLGTAHNTQQKKVLARELNALLKKQDKALDKMKKLLK